jgi:Ni,Fe-hydrogenase III large subunit
VHAGTIEPGHFRLSVVGEKVLRLEERLGYAHKGIELRFTQLAPLEGHRLAGRVSGDSTVAYAWAYCMALESAAACELAPRAQSLRALMLERERVANHLGDLGAVGNDAGLGVAQFSRLKEDWLRLSGELFGHRFMMDCVLPGGVACDLDAMAVDRMVAQCGAIESEVQLLRTMLDEHAGLQDRFAGTGRVSAELAVRLGLTGLAARASGQPRDLRCDQPWPPYDALAVRLATHSGGDVAARVAVRFDEVFESLRLIRATSTSPRHRRWIAAGRVPHRAATAAGTRARRRLGRGLARRGAGGAGAGLAGRRAAGAALPLPRSFVAELAGDRTCGDRQHRSRLPADQQILQPQLLGPRPVSPSQP